MFMKLLLLAVVLLSCSCAIRQPAPIDANPIRHVIEFKHQPSSQVMVERLRKELGERYPEVQFTPERYVQQVYVCYDDCFDLSPEALEAIRLKVEELDRSEDPPSAK